MTYAIDTDDLSGGPLFPFDFEPAYRAAGYSNGIAWRAYGFESEPDADTEWTGLEIPTGRILAHMIGDDQPFSFDPDDLTPLGDLDYCAQCGQVGCTHDGRARD